MQIVERRLRMALGSEQVHLEKDYQRLQRLVLFHLISDYLVQYGAL